MHRPQSFPRLLLFFLVNSLFLYPPTGFTHSIEVQNVLFEEDEIPASVMRSGSLQKRNNSTRDVFAEFQLNLTYYSSIMNTISSTTDLDFSQLIVNAFVEIAGDGGVNGNVRMGVSLLKDYGVSLFFDNLGSTNSTIIPLTRFVGENLVKSIKVGSLKIDNSDLFDPNTGKGSLNDVWSQNNNYQFKTHNSVDFVVDLVKKLELPISSIADFYSNFKRQITSSKVDLEIKDCLLVGLERSDGGSGQTKAFKVSTNADPQATTSGDTQDITGTKDGAAQVIKSTDDIAGFFQNEGRNPFLVYADEAHSLDTDPFVPSGQETFGTEAQSAKTAVIEGTTELALVRSRGIFSTVTTIASEAAETIGELQAALAPAFVILDLVQGNWQAAYFGAAAAVSGVLAGMMISGPIGFLFGAAISTFFSIIPGMIDGGEPYTDNPAQIVQNAFFGKPSKTGVYRPSMGKKNSLTKAYRE